jgi:hypothetical protein
VRAKPKSWGALLDSVGQVNHPEIDCVDKCILLCLARKGNEMGEGCRPGNAALQAVASLGWSATHERIAKLVRLGLVAYTEKVHGRPSSRFNPTTKASVFRICWEHSAYPSTSSNGKETYYEDEEKHPASEAKTSGESIENIRPKAENIRPMNRTSSPTHPQNNPTPSTTQGMAGEGAFNYQELPEEMRIAPAGKRKGQLAKLIFKHGSKVMERTVRLWYQRRDTGGLRNLWGFFLDECEPVIQDAAKALDAERRENDPVLKAAQEKAQADFEKKAGGLLDGMKERPDEGPQVTRLDELD